MWWRRSSSPRSGRMRSSAIGEALCLDSITRGGHDPHQLLVTDLGHPERRVLLRVLLGFDHEPALIAIVGEALDDGAEIERTVARHGEGAERHRIEEALPGPVESIDHRPADVLHMHVVDACVVMVDGAQHVAPGKSEMASVEQQWNAWAGTLHEGIELRLGLDHRRHMMVVAERHALLGGPLAERGDLLG